MIGRCETCRWWEGPGFREDNDAGKWQNPRECGYAWGDCRIRAPSSGGADPSFPRSHKDDWCGEHQPKQTVDAT